LGLENLASVFTEGLTENAETFQGETSVLSTAATNIIDRYEFGFGNLNVNKLPILDTILRQSPSFVSNDLQTKKYESENFDPRVPKNTRIQISNINAYKGTRFIATNPTQFPNEYKNLTTLGLDLENSTGWESLYNKDHTALSIDSPNPNTPFQPYIYGGNVSRDNLSIRYNNSSQFKNTNALSRTELIGSKLGEPYVVSDMATSMTDTGGGRGDNKGSRFLPLTRALNDVERVGKYLSSPKGLVESALKNIGGINKTAVVRRSEGQSPSTSFDNLAIKRVPQRYNKLGPLVFNPLHTLLNVGLRGVGQGLPNVMFESGGLFGIHSPYKGPTTSLGTPYISNTQLVSQGNDKPSGDFENIFSPERVITNDDMTIIDFKEWRPESFTQTNADQFDTKTKGMPFYFIDLRDNKVVYLRAYVEGLTENITPNWAPSNYVGRSEPVYTYERAERDIAFTLTLFAQTQRELKMIYKKMNKLTSLCYPEYKDDTTFNTNAKQRMKPPLMKMRVGDLYGGRKSELTGFLKSLTYTVPENATWAGYDNLPDGSGLTKEPYVPKYLTVSISYHILHDTVPNLNTAFYGYVND